MRWPAAFCLICWLPFVRTSAQTPADSSATPQVVPMAPASVEPVSPARFDSAATAPIQPPAEVARPEKVVAPSSAKRVRSWQLALDFADITDSGLINERHLHQTVDQTNLCCLDVAWLPLASSAGWIQAGGFGNLGGWHQDLSDGTKVTVVDLSLGPSLLGTFPLWPRWRGWARLDLGVSNLLIQRNTTGMDWGWAGAFQVGAAFPLWGALGFFGGGVDFRDYWHLDVKAVPALNLFVGEWI